MHPFFQKGPAGRTVRLFRDIRDLHISTYAGYASFFIILSVFPTLVLTLGLLRYTPLSLQNLMDMAEGFLPSALYGYVWDILAGAYANTTRTVLSVSALAALWSAGKGIYGLMKGLNAIYEVAGQVGWLRTRLLCAVYMVALLMMLLLTLVLQVFGNTLIRFLIHRGGSLSRLATELLGLRYFLLVSVQTLLFTAVFMYLPSRNNRFLESLPGGLFGSFGWMTVSGLFSRYVERSNGYASIFGPVYALALAMLWLYFCVNALFYGGVLNRWLSKYT